MSLIKIVIRILNIIDSFKQKKIIKLINDKLKNSLIIIDVGAHHGETIDIFLKNFKIDHIYSFEASPINYEKLKKKISNIKSNKVEIFNLALGEIKSTKYLNQTLESSSSTINRLNHNSKYLTKKLKILNIKNINEYTKETPIKIITLDEFIDKKQLNNIDLLKIDTEGYEFNILRGLSKHFHKVRLIYFEHHYDDMILKEYKFKDINNLLLSFGFEMISKNKMAFRKSFEYLYENKNKLKL